MRILILLSCCLLVEYAYTQNLSNDTLCSVSIPYYQKVISNLTNEGAPWIGAIIITADKGTVAVGSSGSVATGVGEATITKTDSFGNHIFSKKIGLDAPYNMGFTQDINEYFRDVIALPDTGFIALGPERQLRTGTDIEAPFLVRFDKNGNIVWSKDLIFPEDGEGTFSKILKLAGDTLLLTGTYANSMTFQQTAFIQKMTTDGTILWTKLYGANNNSFILNAKPVIETNGDISLYGMKDFTTSVLLRVDEVGNLLNATEYILPDSLNRLFATTWGMNRVADGYLLGGGLVKASAVNQFEQATLIKTDFIGNILWSKSYRDTTLKIVDMIDQVHIHSSGEIWVNFSDAYSYTLGYTPGIFFDADESALLGRLDANGNLGQTIILQSILPTVSEREHISHVTFFDNDDSNNNAMVVSSKSSSSFFGAPSNNGVQFLKTNLNDLTTNCYPDTLSILTEALSLIQQSIAITVEDATFVMEDFAIPSVDREVLELDWCCQDLPDWDLWKTRQKSACPNETTIRTEICNNGLVESPNDSLGVAFFDAPPSDSGAVLIHTQKVGNLPTGRRCEDYEFIIPYAATGVVYILLNAPDTMAPIIIPCDFLDGAAPMEECSYFNNVDSLHLTEVYEVSVDFGADTLICQEDELILEGHALLTEFLWQDGSTEHTFVVTEPGIYHLTATDNCGLMHQDTIEVGSVAVVPFEFDVDSLLVCADDTLMFTISENYDTYQWLFGPAGALRDCDTCQTVILYPPYSTFNYWKAIGIGISAEGCETKDTLYFEARPPLPVFNIDTFTCSNQPLLLYDNLYPADSSITFNFLTTHGCDSLVTYHITTADTSLTQITTTACLGDTIYYDNSPILAGETATFHYANAKGCDSTIVVAVAALPPAFSQEEVYICEDETALIFDKIETEAGIYTQTYAAANGCDSTHQIELFVYPEVAAEIITVATCPDEAIGQASIDIQSGTSPFVFEWSTPNPSIAEVENLATGNQQVTITDANGCQQILDFFIENREEEMAGLFCEPQIFAPNVFSPNGDSVNDFFYLQSNDRVANITFLRIFDRWGELVFENKDFLPNEENSGWNGVFDGAMMTPQVFIWQVEVEFISGERKVFYGDVVLVR